MIRELILDTETTGLSFENGDKLIEIGIVELVNHIPSKKYFHKYLNPQRSVSESAFKVHGLNYEFLKDKPIFSEVVDEMLEFIANDTIVIHNAVFDLGFLNNELSTIGYTKIEASRVIDTLAMAREKFPGSPASLDALCRRFAIDNSHRELHGALLDSYILANVYLELIGGNQPNFELEGKKALSNQHIEEQKEIYGTQFTRLKTLPSRVSLNEIERHKDFIKKINGLKYWSLYR